MVDIAGTLISGGAVIVTAIVVATIQSGGKTQDPIDAWSRDPIYLATMMVIGVAWVIAGGLVAGLVARRDHVRHAAWVGITTTAWALLFNLAPEPEPSAPLWYEVTSYVVTIPSAMLGGYLAQWWQA